MCATYHHSFRTLVSFDSAFSSKEGVLLHAAQFLFSISMGDQKLFGNQLPGQFPWNLSFQVARTLTMLFPAILVFPLTSANEWNCSTRDRRDAHRRVDDGGWCRLRFSFLIQLKSNFKYAMTRNRIQNILSLGEKNTPSDWDHDHLLMRNIFLLSIIITFY